MLNGHINHYKDYIMYRLSLPRQRQCDILDTLKSYQLLSKQSYLVSEHQTFIFDIAISICLLLVWIITCMLFLLWRHKVAKKEWDYLLRLKDNNETVTQDTSLYNPSFFLITVVHIFILIVLYIYIMFFLLKKYTIVVLKTFKFLLIIFLLLTLIFLLEPLMYQVLVFLLDILIYISIFLW